MVLLLDCNYWTIPESVRQTAKLETRQPCCLATSAWQTFYSNLLFQKISRAFRVGKRNLNEEPPPTLIWCQYRRLSCPSPGQCAPMGIVYTNAYAFAVLAQRELAILATSAHAEHKETLVAMARSLPLWWEQLLLCYFLVSDFQFFFVVVFLFSLSVPVSLSLSLAFSNFSASNLVRRCFATGAHREVFQRGLAARVTHRWWPDFLVSEKVKSVKYPEKLTRTSF